METEIKRKVDLKFEVVYTYDSSVKAIAPFVKIFQQLQHLFFFLIETGFFKFSIVFKSFTYMISYNSLITFSPLCPYIGLPFFPIPTVK